MSGAEFIKEQAAAWLVRRERMKSDPAQLEEFQAWLRADPRHRAAYLRLEAAWRRADVLKRMRPYDGPVDIDILAPQTETPRQRWKPIWFALAASVMFAAVGVVAWRAFAPSTWQTYETEIGSMSRVALRDGSTIQLNTDTEIRVRLRSSRRDVELLRGEAQFDVASDAQRPFQVRAGNTTLRVIGTSFSVRLRSLEKVDVLVTEGRLAVAQLELAPVAVGDIPMPEPVLSAGQAAVVQPSGVQIASVEREAMSRQLAWVTGWLDFDGVKVSDAAEEFNRYNHKRIVIANPDLVTMRVGGRFRATDPESFVAALERRGVKATLSETDVIELH